MKRIRFIHGNTDLLSDNIRGKKVLVLGSGPSAREVNWQSKDWDVLMTTSFFYLNEEVINHKPMHVTLSDIVDLSDYRLLNYLNSNERCTISFETKPHPFYESNLYKDFSLKYKNRIVYYNIQTRGDHNKEGVAARLCWIALAYNPSSISLCGIDGISKKPENDPSNYFRNHRGTKDSYSYDHYLKSFQSFAQELYSAAKESNIPVQNLGKGKPYNMFSNVSEKYEI